MLNLKYIFNNLQKRCCYDTRNVITFLPVSILPVFIKRRSYYAFFELVLNFQTHLFAFMVVSRLPSNPWQMPSFCNHVGSKNFSTKYIFCCIVNTAVGRNFSLFYTYSKNHVKIQSALHISRSSDPGFHETSPLEGYGLPDKPARLVVPR